MEIMKQFKTDKLEVEIYNNRTDMGKAAAVEVADKMRAYIAQQGSVRIIFAAAPSMDDFYEALCSENDIDWSRVVAFTQDEYLGASLNDKYSLINYIKPRLFDRVNPGIYYYIDGSAKNIDEECERYATLITQKPNDITCIGIGDNGHIAFNEPHEADFQDLKVIKTISVDERCKEQQVDNFGFATKEDVPQIGITLTIPTIMKSTHIICIVPTKRKADAVRNTILGPISEKCPASVIRLHDSAKLYLDRDSGSLLL